MSAALRDCIDRYWLLAYAEGMEGRTHDTEAGDAQQCSHEIDQHIAALLAKSAAYEALVAEIAKAPVVTAGSWIRNYMASANRIEYGTRVRLLVSDDRPSHAAGENDA